MYGLLSSQESMRDSSTGGLLDQVMKANSRRAGNIMRHSSRSQPWLWRKMFRRNVHCISGVLGGLSEYEPFSITSRLLE